MRKFSDAYDKQVVRALQAKATVLLPFNKKCKDTNN